MIALSLTFLLYLASSPAWALQSDLAETLSSRLAAQERSIEQELSEYLEEDDIPGALVFVEGLAADGEIDAKRQRALEDRIWRTKTKRMLDYSKKIREAIKVSDLDAMRDYNQRLRRLRSVSGSQTEPAAKPDESDAPDEIVEAEAQEPETEISDTGSSKDAAVPALVDTPDEFAESQASEPETDEMAEVSDPLPKTDVRGPAGGPVLGFPPTSTVAVYAPETALDASSTSPDRGTNGAQRPHVRLGNVSRGARHQTLIDDLINDLLERGNRAIAAYHLTVAPEDTDSALGIVEKLMIMGQDGEPAAEQLGQKILSVYGSLVQRDISQGLYDKASAFIERMDEVAAAAGLPRDEIDLLRAELDAAS